MRSDGTESGVSPGGEDIVDAAARSLRDFGREEGPTALLLAQTRQMLAGVSQRNQDDHSPLLNRASHFVGSAVRTISLAAGTGDRQKPRLVRTADPTGIAQRHLGVWRIATAALILLALAAFSFLLKRHADQRVVVKPSVTSGPNQEWPAKTPTPAPIAPAPVANDRAALPPDAKAPELSAEIPDGVVTGRVIFEGPRRAPTLIAAANALPNSVAAHGGPIYDESLIVNGKGMLANVVVSVSEGLSGWLPEEFPPAEPAVLNQRGCVFEPHVVPVMVGQQLLIKNSDPFLHNVRIMAVNNPPANLGQPSLAESKTAPFESPEVFRVRCDVHPWMGAWVRVMDNPFFAVTGSDGQFTIQGLPPGVYTLKAWHEQLGVREMEVTVEPGHGSAVDFTFHAGTVKFPSQDRN